MKTPSQLFKQWKENNKHTTFFVTKQVFKFYINQSWYVNKKIKKEETSVWKINNKVYRENK